MSKDADVKLVYKSAKNVVKRVQLHHGDWTAPLLTD